MKDIKLYGLHSRLRDSQSMMKYFRLGALTNEFNFIWSPDDFDYLFATEQTYQNPQLFRQFKELYPKAKIHVLWAGEAMSPDFNLFDYAVGFDDGLTYGDRFAQLPPPWEYPGKKFLTTSVNDITTMEQAKKELSSKTGFCNFLYSNSNAHPMRDRLFYEISKYKRVDSLGRHLNNVGQKGTGFSGFQSTCVGIKRPYKFSIACENAVFPGYTSEKILTSLGGHTVPIYFGDPAITNHINPDCFINCNELGEVGQIIQRIKEIDNDDELWMRMVSAPWQTSEQIAYTQQRYENYEAFWRNLFSQKINEAVRIGIGTHPESYRQFFFQKNRNDILKSIKKKLIKALRR